MSILIDANTSAEEAFKIKMKAIEAIGNKPAYKPKNTKEKEPFGTAPSKGSFNKPKPFTKTESELKNKDYIDTLLKQKKNLFCIGCFLKAQIYNKEENEVSITDSKTGKEAKRLIHYRDKLNYKDIQLHHLKKDAEGKKIKRNDSLILPLCKEHHLGIFNSNFKPAFYIHAKADLGIDNGLSLLENIARTMFEEYEKAIKDKKKYKFSYKEKK